MNIATLLKQLSQTPGISSHEAEIRSLVLKEWGRWADETRVDKVGNALAICRGTDRAVASRRADRKAALRRSIMLATHMDEIGLMVAGVQIMVDMGRPDRLPSLLIYGRLQSPLLWDVASLTLYLLVSMFALFASWVDAGKWTFAAALILMIVSMLISLRELTISVGALDLLLSELEEHEKVG